VSRPVDVSPTVHAPYDDAFFSEHRDGAYSSAAVVAPLIVDLIAPRRVIDVGCGTGTWLRVFSELGCDVLGVDGAYVPRGHLEIPSRLFIEQDLVYPLGLTGTWDLAISLEVAEHLPSSSAAAFADGLAGLAPVLLFSAAIPNQGGLQHLNEQWPAYWIEHFDDGRTRAAPRSPAALLEQGAGCRLSPTRSATQPAPRSSAATPRAARRRPSPSSRWRRSRPRRR
jgi:SAM-dependent methyltransferase